MNYEWALRSVLYDPRDPIFFTGAFFLFFFLLFFIVYIPLSKTVRGRTLVILTFSLWFYYKCSGPFVLVILAMGLLNFLVAKAMYGEKSDIRRTLLLSAGVILNIGVLALFKYTPYFIKAAELLAIRPFNLTMLIFPAGISFYTFANLSYILDVKKGVLPPERSVISYLTYVTFFPIVQMGPIERAKSFLPQLSRPFLINREDVAGGFYLILTGAFKKMVIGDYINLHLVTQVFSTPEQHTGMENLAAVLGYSLVIYCDFSGYTDMARGIARWMGFDIRVNFNFPYRSENIGEFWKRWHISLSNWLRDYLFLPIAFRLSRMIKKDCLFSLNWLRTDLVIFSASALITFSICGIWHGIGWNFLLWGVMHGVALGVQKSWSYFVRHKKRGMKGLLKKLDRITGIVLTFAFVSVAWVFFRSSTPGDGITILSQITSNFYLQGFGAFVSSYWPVLLMMAVGYVFHFLPDTIYQGLHEKLMATAWPWKALIAMATVAVIVYFKSMGSVMPIYIQF